MVVSGKGRMARSNYYYTEIVYRENEQASLAQAALT
jgi:hypothetical protein